MSILHVVDNKYRDLWGLYEIRKKLREKKIRLFFCNKFNWNLAIKHINPSIIILPHIRADSPHFKKIVDSAYEKKIKIICYPSESLDYRKPYLENEFPSNILNKIDKLFMWTAEQGKYIDDKNKDKIVVTGTTRFKNDETTIPKGKIETIGITSSGRYLAPLTGNNNIIYAIKSRQKVHWAVSLVKGEVEFIDFLCQLMELAKELNIKLIFKPHPFEKISLYREALPDLIIEDDPDIRNFLKKIDVCINHISSANLQALKSKVPVINISNALNLNDEFKEFFQSYVPSKLGIPAESIENLKKILINNNIEDLFNMNIKRGDLKALQNLVPNYDTINIITSELSKMYIEQKRRKFINLIPYFLKEVYLVIFKKNRDTLFRPFSKKDENLLKKFT
jgi:surface carbohydrate biosynthesis protein